MSCCIQLSSLLVGPFLCPGVVYQSGTEWPVASLSRSQVQSGTGSNSGLLTLTVCRLCLHVAGLVHYQTQRGMLTLANPSGVHYESLLAHRTKGETMSGLDKNLLRW